AEEDDKRAPGFGARRQLGPVEAAIEACAGEGDVIGTIVDERPPEHLFEEARGGAEVPGRVLDVVDLFVSRHSGLRPWQKIGGAAPAVNGCLSDRGRASRGESVELLKQRRIHGGEI